MYKSSRGLFPFFILIVSTIVILNSCSNDRNPFGCEDNLIEDNFIGKLESDFGNYAILKPDGTLWTWGNNYNGQLGIGTKESSNIPLKVSSIEKIIDIDFCEGMALAVDCAGNIWYWGRNTFSSTMGPEILSPKKISFLRGTEAIEMCFVVHTLRNDGTVWQIKIDHKVNTSYYNPEIISGMEQILSISNSLALKKDGTLCEILSSEPDRGGWIAVKDVVAVQNVLNRRTVILKKDGTAWAWGKNGIGQLGSGDFQDSSVPVKVKNLSNIIKISANYDFNLALREDGTVWFWGFICQWDANQNPIGINIPERIKNLDNVVLIHAGSQCLVMKDDGSYWYFAAEDRIPQKISFE